MGESGGTQTKMTEEGTTIEATPYKEADNDAEFSWEKAGECKRHKEEKKQKAATDNRRPLS